MVKPRVLSLLAFGATFFALGVIALGAFTRLFDAGLGCPDWPGCYGHFVAPDNAYKAWAEMIHRYFVGGLSLFIIAIVVCILCQKNLRSKFNIICAVLLLLLLAYQIMLGQWTVTLKLLPIIVTQHLLGGFSIASILWLICLNNNIDLKKRLSVTPTGFFWGGIVGVVLLVLQIFLGAWTSTNYAANSCTGFPFCMNDQSQVVMQFKTAFNLFSPVGVNYEGGVLPEAVRQTIQMTHRFGALIVSIYLFAFMLYALIKLQQAVEILKSIYLVLILLCVQICLGISNVIFKLPLANAISHTVVAILLLLAMLSFVFKVCQK